MKTHAELISRAEKWLLNSKRCGFCLTELVTYSVSGEIPDIIGWQGTQSHLIECKTSKADFYRDRKKIFRQLSYLGVGVYRYFMSEPGVIDQKSLPSRWGLLYVYPKQIRIILVPTAFDTKEVALAEKPLLCSALRRLHQQGYKP